MMEAPQESDPLDFMLELVRNPAQRDRAVSDLQGRIETLRAQIRDAQAALLLVQMADPSYEPPRFAHRTRRSPTPGAAMSFPTAMILILQEYGRPMSVAQMTPEVVRLREVPMEDGEGGKRLYTAATQSQRLKSRGGWIGLAEWPETSWDEPVA